MSALRRVRALLADDLGVDPGPGLQTLERRLLAQDPGLLLPADVADPAAAELDRRDGRAWPPYAGMVRVAGFGPM